MAPHPARTVFALLGAFAALMTGFSLLVRPWYLEWGATTAETRKVLPGDEIIPGAARQETRAITIRAPMARVWPWLAQIGQDRGGFYSYDLLENMVGCEMPVFDAVRPEHQEWQIGDKLWMYPENRAGGLGYATLQVQLPGRALGFGTRTIGASPGGAEDGSWSFVLEPAGDSATRLLIRGRGAGGRSLLGTAFDKAIFEPIHFVMERRMMIGLKQLSEGHDRKRSGNHLQIGLWVVAFALMIASVVLAFRRSHPGRSVAGFIAAAMVFQILTLGQPPLWAGVALLGGVAVLLWWRVEGPAAPVQASHA